jgi:hypothetical protein
MVPSGYPRAPVIVLLVAMFNKQEDDVTFRMCGRSVREGLPLRPSPVGQPCSGSDKQMFGAE